MNQFGGNWTEKKIQMVINYARAYLTIMNKHPRFRTLYFDGFAGSGDIYRNDIVDFETIRGAAIRIMKIEQPKPFDTYYFVEKNESNKVALEEAVRREFPARKCYIVCDDCNTKLKDMAAYLKNQPDLRVLAFIDPYGMALNWSSIELLKGCGIDMWILVPTGIGVNRLLKNNGEISDAWLAKLEKFLGMTKTSILEYFYKKKKVFTLFGEETETEKEIRATERAGELYRERLHNIFLFVSKSFPLTNSTGSVMYHFMLATNNRTAAKIADEIIAKQ